MTAPVCIKITKYGAYISGNRDGIEIPVSKAWVRQYVEYMLATNQEVSIETAP